MHNGKLTCLDLFSGAGGLSKGFLDAGYDVVLGVDYDEAALETWKNNHGDGVAMRLDLFNHDNLDIITGFLEDRNIELDVLVGGPPCQGFSVAGPRDMNDKRNFLYTAMVELTRRVEPKAVVLENVPGMIQINDGIGAQRIVDDFEKIGYKMVPKLLYAPDYGVPQIRKRVFFVGLKDNKKKFVFPKAKYDKKSYITCEEAINDLPSLQTNGGEIIYGEEVQAYPCGPKSPYQEMMRKHSAFIFNHIGSIPIEKTRKMISMVPEGKNYKALPPEYRDLYKYHEALTRYNGKKPSLTINTGHRSHFHYKWNRIPTVRESARLQSFPDDFIFYGNKSEQYRQVGNAVPPLLGKVVAEQLKKYLISPDAAKEGNDSRKKIRFIDLFAGCGGLEDGFLGTGKYKEIAALEWLKPQVDTLRKRLLDKYDIEDADERVMQFDIQKDEQMFGGWKEDPEFGEGKGLDYFVDKEGGLDIIIGGPPCQAYSIAGRVRDENGMKDDYRNYLFEHYLNVVNRYKPVLFVFENVPGILSAAPDGEPIVSKIRAGFSRIGYEIVDDLKKWAKVNAAQYSVPQNRQRMIIIGIRREKCKKNPQEYLHDFYERILPKYRGKKIITVGEALGDLPKFTPVYDEINHSKRVSHLPQVTEVNWHIPRYHSVRDMKIYSLLAEDIESGRREFDSKKMSKLYEERVGAKSPIHRYHVLEPDLPSTTIIAHIYKDGNRFIHYDSKQARSITVREAARLQSFDDDFVFVGNRGNAYEMIGNAVPPKLAEAIGNAVYDLYFELMEEQ